MIKHVYLLTNDRGMELRYERYARSASIMDAMLAQDSAVKAFTESHGKPPRTVREVAA